MRLFLLLLVGVLLAAGAYVVLNAEKVPEPVTATRAGPAVHTVTCPLCSGEGMIVQVNRPPHAEESETRYRCPLCYGKGKRKVAIKLKFPPRISSLLTPNPL